MRVFVPILDLSRTCVIASDGPPRDKNGANTGGKSRNLAWVK